MTARRKSPADAVLGAVTAPEPLETDLARISAMQNRVPDWSVSGPAALAFKLRLKLGEEGFGGVRHGLWGRCPGCGVAVRYSLSGGPGAGAGGLQDVGDLLRKPFGKVRDFSVGGKGEVAVEIVGGHGRDPITEGLGGRRGSGGVNQHLGQHDFVHRGHEARRPQKVLQRLQALLNRLFRHRRLSPPVTGRTVAWPPEDIQ